MAALFNSSNTNTSNYNNQSQSSGSSQTVLPQDIQDAAHANLGYGMDSAYSWNPALQQAPADFSPMQNDALSSGYNAAQQQPGQESLRQGNWAFNNAITYQPQQ